MHTFSIQANRANAFGCGTSWGDIDILVLPEKLTTTLAPTKKPVKTVVAYQTGDSRSGCPRAQGANTPLITRKVTVKEDSYVQATGHMIRLYSGRADLHLRLNNKIVDYSLTYTPSRQWKDTQVYWVGSIKKGTQTFTVTGSRANAFGCGSTWGDLDILVIPKLSGVAVYQFGIPSGCPSTNLVFTKTITLPKDSVVYATGHIITNQRGGRADLYLKINNGMRDYALSEDSTGQWVDLTVNHATTLKKGKYTFQITSNKNARFGCGAGWGDLDIVVVPKFKGVAAYNEPDRKSGCPAKRAANTDLILKTIKVDQTSIIKVTGHIIRTFSGRADAYLKYQRKSTLDTSLTYTNNRRWEDVKLHWTGRLGKGTHTFSIRSNRANAFGCGTAWGDLDILVLPEKLVGTSTPAPAPAAKTVVAYQTGDGRSGCPRAQGANTPLITRRVTVKEDSYVVATGHMIRLYSGRADLHLRLNNKILDYSLTYTPSRQWKDTQVYWVGSIKKGTQTFTVTGSRANAFGCGSTWGDLDILVIPKLSGVAVYQFGIPSGCPSTNLVFTKTITLPKIPLCTRPDTSLPTRGADG